jgi:2-keto-3-deoxy-L-rhamnonate aldolase RhmA
MAAEAGAPAVVFDLQHGLWDRASYEAGVGAVRGASVPLARTADASAFAIGSALDAGALGVLVPMVDSAEIAAASVAAAHYPPRGHRSGGGVRPLADFAAYAAAAPREILVAPMVETLAAVDAADAIAAVPGVDLVFIGTGDLGLSLAASGRTDVTVEALCRQVLDACRRRGVPCGVFTPDAATARARLAEGYRFAVAANDIDLNRRGLREAMRAARED